MAVSFKEYNDDRLAFFQKHGHDFQCETTPMDEYGRYWKTYTFADGARWCEAMSPVYEEAHFEIHGCKCKADVKFLRTEYWNTEACSKYYYEKW